MLVAGYADPLLLWNLASDLADMAGCPVDLLDLRAASTVMQYQVITTADKHSVPHIHAEYQGQAAVEVPSVFHLPKGGVHATVFF